MQGLFSKRFRRALSERKIPYPSFSRVLRKRLAMTCLITACGDVDPSIQERGDVRYALQKAYGKDTLSVKEEGTDHDRDAEGFEDFLVFAYPHCVLDALEAFYRLLPDERRGPFQSDLNEVLAEEASPWRMSDGHMYLVDSHFLDALKDQVEEEMKREGFLGAYEEFKDARRYLQAGAVDDAIHKANCAFESALKSLLYREEGTADDLLKMLREKTDLLDAVPVEAQKALVLKVLQGLPVLRHKLGGHGQGTQPVNVPRAYGDLAINLAATYIKFLLDIKKDLAPTQEPQGQTAVADELDDDLPF